MYGISCKMVHIWREGVVGKAKGSNLEGGIGAQLRILGWSRVTIDECFAKPMRVIFHYLIRKAGLLVWGSCLGVNSSF